MMNTGPDFLGYEAICGTWLSGVVFKTDMMNTKNRHVVHGVWMYTDGLAQLRCDSVIMELELRPQCTNNKHQ